MFLEFISYLIIIAQNIFEKTLAFILKHKYVRVYLAAGIAFVFVIVFSSFLFDSDVNAQEDELLHKYYTCVQIEYGNTLWSLADDYGTLGYDSKKEYIDEVRQINRLEDINDLKSGDTIILPYYSYEIL